MMTLLCLVGLLPQVAAQEDERETAGVRYRLWLASLSGTVESDRPAVDGTDVRLTTDLGVDETEVFHDLGGWVRITDWGGIRAQYLFGTFEGTEDLDSTISFGGTIFSAGSEVDSEVSIHLVTALFELDLWEPEDLGIDAWIRLQIGGKYVRSSTDIESSVSSADGELNGFLPVVGARSSVAFSDLFRAELEINGLILPLGDTSIRLIDGALDFGITPWEGLYAGVGYRLVYVYALDETDSDEKEEADLRLSGVYFFVGWRF